MTHHAAQQLRFLWRACETSRAAASLNDVKSPTLFRPQKTHQPYVYAVIRNQLNIPNVPALCFSSVKINPPLCFCQIPSDVLRIISWFHKLWSRTHQSQEWRRPWFCLDCQAVTPPPALSQSTVKILRFDLPAEQIIGSQLPSENSCMTPEVENKSRMMDCQPCYPRQPFTSRSRSFTGDDSAFWWRPFFTLADSCHSHQRTRETLQQPTAHLSDTLPFGWTQNTSFHLLFTLRHG